MNNPRKQVNKNLTTSFPPICEVNRKLTNSYKLPMKSSNFEDDGVSEGKSFLLSLLRMFDSPFCVSNNDTCFSFSH